MLIRNNYLSLNMLSNLQELINNYNYDYDNEKCDINIDCILEKIDKEYTDTMLSTEITIVVFSHSKTFFKRHRDYMKVLELLRKNKNYMNIRCEIEEKPENCCSNVIFKIII